MLWGNQTHNLLKLHNVALPRITPLELKKFRIYVIVLLIDTR